MTTTFDTIAYHPFKIHLSYSIQRRSQGRDFSEADWLAEDKVFKEKSAHINGAMTKLQAHLMQEEVDENAPFSFLDFVTEFSVHGDPDCKSVVLQAYVPEKLGSDDISFSSYFEKLTNELAELGLIYEWLNP